MRPVLIDARRRFRLRNCDDLLGRGTEIAIGTIRAVIAGFRGKFSPRDSLRHFLHVQFCRFQLGVSPRGADGRVVFEVMEDQAVSVLSPRLPGRECIQGELQALVGILL